jgi:hypothetical protein
MSLGRVDGLVGAGGSGATSALGEGVRHCNQPHIPCLSRLQVGARAPASEPIPPTLDSSPQGKPTIGPRSVAQSSSAHRPASLHLVGPCGERMRVGRCAVHTPTLSRLSPPPKPRVYSPRCPRQSPVMTSDERGDSRGAWVARLPHDADHQPDAGVEERGRRPASAPVSPTRKGGCSMRV